MPTKYFQNEQETKVIAFYRQAVPQHLSPKATLNDDCFYQIFEFLDLFDLVNMAEVSALFYDIALYEFKQKYSNHPLGISTLENTPKSFLDKIFGKGDKNSAKLEHMFTFEKQYQYYRLLDYQFALKTLKYFGGVIKEFEMRHNNLNDNVIKTVFQHLNKYSARSLAGLHIGTTKLELLNELKGPMQKLNTFSFGEDDSRKREFNPRWLFREKFPNLRQLIFLNWKGNSDNVFPIEHFPHLEYVKIEFDWNLDNPNRINKFFKINPQIRHVDLVGFPADYIVNIHSFIPKLEKLTIGREWRRDSIEVTKAIHFENMKSFNVLCKDVESLENISFSNLQELRIVYFYSRSIGQWEQFFQRNHTFTHFEVTEAHDLPLSTIDKLPPSVNEITLNYKQHRFNKETIIHALETCGNLMKLTCKNNVEIQDVVFELEDDWVITTPDDLDEGRNGLQFTRKIEDF